MDFRLKPWLEDTVQEQLLLGNYWLQEKNKVKALGVKAELDSNWEELYCDNGSCLDIINGIHPERNSALQVLQTIPLTLTDGRCRVVAHLTPDCLQDLSRRYPGHPHVALHAVVAVRKYTIRYTSYGPPRSKLRFILHTVDWLGVDTGRINRTNSEALKPLHWNEDIGAVLEQLHHTRAREDVRCLRPDTEPGEDDESMAAAMDVDDGAPAGESTPHTQLPHTQFTFATQMAHPIRSRVSEDEPQILGINRLEPVLAGNTRREEIRPTAANSDYEKRNKLLGLLAKTAPRTSPGKPSPASAKGFVRTAFDKQQNVSKPSTAHNSPRPTPIVDDQQTQAGAQEDKARPAPTNTTSGKRRVRESEPIKPAVVQPVEEQSDTRQDAEQASLNDLPTLECPWMKDFVFDREALKVPLAQRDVLQKPTSWHNPQPGYPGLTEGNIPILTLKTLSLIADERAAAEDASDTDSEEGVDPSPEEVPGEVNSSEEAMPLLTQVDEPTMSQVSWSASPSPEPPLKLKRSRQALPPDSSFYAEGLKANKDVDRQPSESRVQSERPITLDSPNDKEPSPPPSSPPVAALPADSDEEMEMETLVPQGLGEDALQVSCPQSVNKKPASTGSVTLKPVVQVEETPHAKGKNGQTPKYSMSPPKQKHSSSSNSKHTSSGEIVYGTYNEQSSSVSMEGKNRQDHTTNDAECRLQNARAGVTQREETEKYVARVPDDVVPQDVAMPDRPSSPDLPPKQVDDGNQAQAVPLEPVAEELLASQPEPTPVSAQVPPNTLSSVSNQPPSTEANSPKPDPLAPGLTKRKLIESPTKPSRRHSKRREIKIVGFGDNTPSNVSSTAALREERAESLRRFRQERNSSTSFEVQAGSNCGQQDADAMEVDSPRIRASDTPLRAMSPRHMSLYEEPLATKPLSRTLSTLRPPPLVSRSHLQPETGSTMSRTASAMETREQTQSTAAINQEASPTVFQAFKAAYPEYTGGIKHFESLCTQIYELDLDDRMVPKWQWDDFIIRNRTDYKDYAINCADEGENPEPYIRFYKDSIRDTLFKTGIIESRATLLKVFDQLDVNLPAPALSTQPVMSSRRSTPSRASLPGAFNLPNRSTQDRINDITHDRPRYSLPPNSHNHLQNPNPAARRQTTSHNDAPNDRRTSRSNLLQRLTSSDQLQPPGAATDSTGDPFRDYYFGLQRSTSWTGSTKVDRRKPWPQNHAVRPSIADVPREKPDVLKWKHDL